MPGGIPSIGVAGSQLQHARTLGSNPERRARGGGTSWAQHAVVYLVVMPVKIHLPLSEQRDNHLQGFLKAAGKVIKRVAEGFILPLVPPGAQTQDQASPADLVNGVCYLGKQRRGAKRRAGHQRSQRDARGNCRQSAQHAEDLPEASLLFSRKAVEQMVSHPQRSEPHLLSSLRQLAQIPKAGGPALQSPFQRG